LQLDEHLPSQGIEVFFLGGIGHAVPLFRLMFVKYIRKKAIAPSAYSRKTNEIAFKNPYLLPYSLRMYGICSRLAMSSFGDLRHSILSLAPVR
jgi:hypothetical protein